MSYKLIFGLFTLGLLANAIAINGELEFKAEKVILETKISKLQEELVSCIEEATR